MSGVQPELNAICMKALASRRYRRYQSASELADDIQRYMTGTKVHAYKAPVQRRLSGWMVRHPTLAQMLLLSMSLILIVGIAVALTAREGRQRLVRARFASAIETTQDMEVNLQFEAHALERDLHFITELPLMTVITESQIAAQAESSSDSVMATQATNPDSTLPAGRAVTPLDIALQTPEQWLDLQGDLFDGFLNANPSYLMMSSCVQEENSRFRELVRAERPTAGVRARRVPSRQLKTSDATPDASDSGILELLRPGSVLLATNDRFKGDIPTINHSPLVLCGVSAIYDRLGELFGINIIELDLGERLRTLIPAIAPGYVDVYVTDASGNIVMDYRGGRFVEVAGTQSVVSEFPELSALFAENSTVRELGDDQRYYATLVQLGQSTTRARVGIVTHVVDQ